jgi:multidrug efflux pump subunit AcrA (membrane-fusion protein)
MVSSFVHLSAKTLLILLSTLASLGTRTSYAKATPDVKRPITVEAKRINPEAIQDIIYLPGRTETSNLTPIVVETDALVVSCSVVMGSVVAKNTPLCTLRSNDPGFTNKLVPVRAPISGSLSELLVAPGTMVTRGTVIGRLVPEGSARFVVNVPFASAQVVSVNQQGQLEAIDGSPLPLMSDVSKTEGQTSRAQDPMIMRCVAKSPTADPSTATIRTEWAPVGDRSLANIQLARLKLVLASRQGFRLPQRAVRYDGGKPYVRLVQNSVIAHAPVVLGSSDGAEVEILSGLKTGDLFVVRASRYVKSGDIVEVEDAPEAPRAQK